jgi:hypothetical protein
VRRQAALSKSIANIVLKGELVSKQNASQRVVVIAFAPQWRKWQPVSKEILRSEAAPIIAEQWAQGRLARVTPIKIASAA